MGCLHNRNLNWRRQKYSGRSSGWQRGLTIPMPPASVESDTAYIPEQAANISVPDLRPKTWLFAAGLRGIFLGLYRPERQAIVDGDSDQRNQTDGGNRMHEEHQPMPRRCIRAFDGALECHTRRQGIRSTGGLAFHSSAVDGVSRVIRSARVSPPLKTGSA